MADEPVAFGVSRRDVLRTGAATLAVLATPLQSTLAATYRGELFVKTRTGSVSGLMQGETRVFPGIPFAAVTGGIHRFIAPRAVEPWSDVLELDAADASRRGDAREVLTRLEDRPRLDVITMNTSPATPRPVRVEVQDAHFDRATGAGDPPTDDPVIVRVGHRRGVLGFTHLGGLLDREFTSSGNAGLLDIVQALEWVRDNIAAFGGDPGAVTLAGGDTVACIQAMPAARGLFHQTTTTATPRLATPESADRAARELLKALEIAPAKARSLQQVPLDTLGAAYDALVLKLPKDVAFGPVVDDLVLPRRAFAANLVIG